MTEGKIKKEDVYTDMKTIVIEGKTVVQNTTFINNDKEDDHCITIVDSQGRAVQITLCTTELLKVNEFLNSITDNYGVFEGLKRSYIVIKRK